MIAAAVDAELVLLKAGKEGKEPDEDDMELKD